VGTAVAVYTAASAVVCFDFGRAALDGLCFAVLMAVFAVALGAVALIVKRFSRRIGGVTGDIIGFSVEASQLFYLLLLGAAMQLLG
jgi:cobalamin synthase